LINWKTIIDLFTIIITLVPVQKLQVLRALRLARVWPIYIVILRTCKIHLYRTSIPSPLATAIDQK